MNFLFIILSVLFRPTFTSCGITPQEEVKGCTLYYCESSSGNWTEVKDFRGSLTGLEENTEYKVRFTSVSGTEETGSFRTWKSDVPIGRTIKISPKDFKGGYIVDCKGEDNAWIRITSAGGTLFNPSDKPSFIIRNASHVILEDMVLRGAADANCAVLLEDCEDIRIRNCDIAGWGASRYEANLSRKKKGETPGMAGNGQYARPDGTFINREAAIRISKGSSKVVVERCFIHDPLPRACAWYYCHPAGPNAILMDKPDHSTVIRWNDFIGSDLHRWNDAVEGVDNFSPTGGFNRDADIYGNFMIFANDDCIELDGGQQNVRCFGNRFESAFCGVSVQGCVVGPSFVYDNLFSGMCDEFGHSGQTLKTSDFKNGGTSRSYLYDNVFWGKGSGVSGRYGFYSFIERNTFYGKQKVHVSKKAEPFTVVRDNVSLEPIPETELSNEYPRRPLGFTLSRSRVTVGKERKPVVVMINGALPSGSYIAKPAAMDWLVPVLKKDRVIIKFRKSAMKDRREYRGAFIVRTPNGISRPVSVYASTDFVPPVKPKNVKTAIYAEDFKLLPKETKNIIFEVPEDGRYWFFIHGMSGGGNQTVSVSVNDSKFENSIQQQYDYPTWSMLNPGSKPVKLMTTHYDLKKGAHTLVIKYVKGKYPFDGAVLTDSPKAFEPR